VLSSRDARHAGAARERLANSRLAADGWYVYVLEHWYRGIL
jgi:hypothetical protein